MSRRRFVVLLAFGVLAFHAALHHRTPAITSGPAWLLALAFLTPYLICVALFVHGGRARRRSQQDLGAAERKLAALEPERVPLEAERPRG